MKRVGLITYYGENYGGMLQAYALQKKVYDLGYDCKIISNDFLYRGKKISRKKALLKKLKLLISDPFGNLKRRHTMRKYAMERGLKKHKFLEFSDKYLKIDYNGYTSYSQYLENPPEYDVYLCGSDQIWNPNLYHNNGFYFADFAPSKATKISYASSVGVSSITKEQADFMRPFLAKIDVISTREFAGSEIVRDLTGKDVRTVLDPTLLLSSEQWSEVAAEPLVEGEYIFLYLFGERDYIEKVKNQIRQMTGFKTVCIPYAARELSGNDIKIYDAGPAEFISLIKNAALVVTDSFHATAFSVNLKVPFISLCRFARGDSVSMNSRLDTLLGTLDLKERIIDEGDSITKEMLFDIDYEKVHEKLNAVRNDDLKFLREALELEKN